MSATQHTPSRTFSVRCLLCVALLVCSFATPTWSQNGSQDRAWMQRNQEAMHAMARGQLGEAEQLLLALIQRTEKIVGAEKNLAASLNNLGQVYHRQQKLELAEKALRRALTIRIKVYGEINRYVGQAHNNLAHTLQFEQKYQDAEHHYAQALAIYTRIYGAEHPLVALTLNNLGSMYRSIQRYDDAKQQFKRAYDIQTQFFGKHHPLFATTLSNLASIAVLQGEMDAAETFYLKVIDNYTHATPRNYYKIVIAMNNLATIYANTCRYSQMIQISQQALQTVNDHLHNQHSEKAALQTRLALGKAASGSAEVAIKLYDDAYVSEQMVSGKYHPKLIPILEAQAKVLRQLDRNEKAAEKQFEAETIRSKHSVPNSALQGPRRCGPKVAQHNQHLNLLL